MHRKITIVYQENADGLITATLQEYPGAISQERTLEEARDMVLDSMNELMMASREAAALISVTSTGCLDFEVMVAKFGYGPK